VDPPTDAEPSSEPLEEGFEPGRPDRSHAWRRLRRLLALAVLGAAAWYMASQFSDLAAAARRLTGIDFAWVVLAVAAEAGSMVVFAGLQRRLLKAAGTRVPLGRMTALTLASNSINATFPGGVAWAAAWLFNRLGRWGVDRFHRVWVFLVAGGVSSFALFLVLGTGVELAGSHGPVASLRWLVLLLALIPVVALVVEAFHTTAAVRRLGAFVDRRLRGLPGGPSLRRVTVSTVQRFTAVRLRPGGWCEVLVFAITNWLLDCAVLVASMKALHVAVPWRALLVIYGLTQISAAVPITPGGIGVVAGSLGALLHAYGMPAVDALSVVILYRILTFYFLVPLGWAVFGVIEAWSRHRPPQAAPAPADAPVPRRDVGTQEPLEPALPPVSARGA
jgi:uncharacterized protein (TIRG00374 family)